MVQQVHKARPNKPWQNMTNYVISYVNTSDDNDYPKIDNMLLAKKHKTDHSESQNLSLY